MAIYFCARTNKWISFNKKQHIEMFARALDIPLKEARRMVQKKPL